MPLGDTPTPVTPTVDERVDAILSQMTDTTTKAQGLLRELTDRDVIFALAADTGRIYEMTAACTPLMEMGALMQSRLTQIVTIGRSVDSIIDPATIEEVR